MTTRTMFLSSLLSTDTDNSCVSTTSSDKKPSQDPTTALQDSSSVTSFLASSWTSNISQEEKKNEEGSNNSDKEEAGASLDLSRMVGMLWNGEATSTTMEADNKEVKVEKKGSLTMENLYSMLGASAGEKHKDGKDRSASSPDLGMTTLTMDTVYNMFGTKESKEQEHDQEHEESPSSMDLSLGSLTSNLTFENLYSLVGVTTVEEPEEKNKEEEDKEDWSTSLSNTITKMGEITADYYKAIQDTVSEVPMVSEFNQEQENFILVRKQEADGAILAGW